MWGGREYRESNIEGKCRGDLDSFKEKGISVEGILNLESLCSRPEVSTFTDLGEYEEEGQKRGIIPMD